MGSDLWPSYAGGACIAAFLLRLAMDSVLSVCEGIQNGSGGVCVSSVRAATSLHADIVKG